MFQTAIEQDLSSTSESIFGLPEPVGAQHERFSSTILSGYEPDVLFPSIAPKLRSYDE